MVRLGVCAIAALAVACHTGEQRGTKNLGPDPLIGCWKSNEKPKPWRFTLTDKERYTGELLGGDDEFGPIWTRETHELISFNDPPETVQIRIDDEAEATTLDLDWQELDRDQHLHFERLADDDTSCPKASK